MSGLGFIALEPKGICSRCEQRRELRPYGPGGALVCHPCAQLNPVELVRGMHRYIAGEELPEDRALWPAGPRSFLESIERGRR